LRRSCVGIFHLLKPSHYADDGATKGMLCFIRGDNTYKSAIQRVSAVEQAMIQLKTNSNAPRWGSQHRIAVFTFETAAHFLRAQAAAILRLLVLVLVGLLFVLIGLALLTGHTEIGAPIIGIVLFAGFSAAQFGR
jgi:hypothetical protein